MDKCCFVLQYTFLFDLLGNWSPGKLRKMRELKKLLFFVIENIEPCVFSQSPAAVNCCLSILPLMKTIIFME